MSKAGSRGGSCVTGNLGVVLGGLCAIILELESLWSIVMLSRGPERDTLHSDSSADSGGGMSTPLTLTTSSCGSR